MARKTTTNKPKRSTAARTRKPREAAATVQKQAKPVFRLGTLIAVIMFAAIVGAAYYLNANPIKTGDEADATPAAEDVKFVFDSTSLVKSIEVKPADGKSVRLERNEEKLWELTSPDKAEADQGLAEAAASQVSALLIDLEFSDDPAKFGLAEPAYVITVEFEDGKTGKLEVGDITPTTSGYYVRLDGDKMFIVSTSGIEALINLVSTPPYLATATPEVTPTP